MKQMSVDDSLVVHLNYDREDLPQSVKEFRPILFQEGDAFCCLLGPDPRIGVFGCGQTKEEAIKDWDADFRQRIKDRKNPSRNEVTQYILDTMATSKSKVW